MLFPEALLLALQEIDRKIGHCPDADNQGLLIGIKVR
jgi:hypothetical protein